MRANLRKAAAWNSAYKPPAAQPHAQVAEDASLQWGREFAGVSLIPIRRRLSNIRGERRGRDSFYGKIRARPRSRARTARSLELTRAQRVARNLKLTENVFANQRLLFARPDTETGVNSNEISPRRDNVPRGVSPCFSRIWSPR